MKFHWLSAVCALLIAAAAMSGNARAGTVLYDGSSVIAGQQAFVQPFTVTGPGTVTFTVSSVPWLDVVADLNCFLSTSTNIVGASMGLGSESVQIGAGTYYAHWFGDAQGPYNEGVLGIKIQFQPSAAPVPLPPSLVLAVSGWGLLLACRRRIAPAPTAC